MDNPRARARAGLGNAARRHQKILRRNIDSITKPAIRRLARRGGVKRISFAIYEDTRAVIKSRLRQIIEELVLVATHCERSTVRVTDIIFVLRRLGTPVYGFDNTGRTNVNCGLH